MQITSTKLRGFSFSPSSFFCFIPKGKLASSQDLSPFPYVEQIIHPFYANPKKLNRVSRDDCRGFMIEFPFLCFGSMKVDRYQKLR